MRRLRETNARPTPMTERRSGMDRRRKSPFNRQGLFSGGRRESGRRYTDRQGPLLADRYQQSLFGVIVLILFLSVIDAILTLFLINHGAIEINPIMAFYLGVGPYTFLFVKYALTSVGLILLLLFRRLFLRSMRIFAGSLLYVILIAFLGVVSWQLYLVHGVIT
jgi:hypothetical protein